MSGDREHFYCKQQDEDGTTDSPIPISSTHTGQCATIEVDREKNSGHEPSFYEKADLERLEGNVRHSKGICDDPKQKKLSNEETACFGMQ